jgi:hypothetical protein
VTNDTSKSSVLPIDLTMHKTTQKTFNPFESNWFSVTRVASRDIDMLRLWLTVMADSQSIEAFLFPWDFGNTSAEKYDQSVKLLVSFLVGFIFVVFCFRSDSEYSTQVLLLVISIFAANPLN